MTVGEQFMDRVKAGGDREAFRFPDGEDWASISWKEVGAKVTRLAAGLVKLGIEPQQRVGIASGTRVEWIYADLAIMCAGAATTTVYPSTMTDDVAYILSDSECHIVFAEDDAQIAKLREKKSELPARRARSSPSRARRTATGSSASPTSRSWARSCSTRTARRSRSASTAPTATRSRR